MRLKVKAPIEWDWTDSEHNTSKTAPIECEDWKHRLKISPWTLGWTNLVRLGFGERLRVRWFRARLGFGERLKIQGTKIGERLKIQGWNWRLGLKKLEVWEWDEKFRSLGLGKGGRKREMKGRNLSEMENLANWEWPITTRLII